MPRYTISAAIALLSLVMVACDHHDADHAGHEHADAHHAHEDVHTPKYGGQLVEVGEHFANVEFVLDAKSGKLTAYMRDAHAENPARIAQPTVDITVTRDGKSQTITLHAVANTLTGETVGDTSQFESEAGALPGGGAAAGAGPVDIDIKELTIRGQLFKNVKATLKPTQ